MAAPAVQGLSKEAEESGEKERRKENPELTKPNGLGRKRMANFSLILKSLIFIKCISHKK